MVSESNLILNKRQIFQKIKRIAFEILEHNLDEKEIIIVGIYPSGYKLAELLINELQSITPKKVTLVKLTLNKSLPVQSEVTLDSDLKIFKNKAIVLVDDVLNTGKTLIYSIKPFLNLEIKKLQTVVLVNRSHKSFPVSADFVGYSLATTIKEHVEVKLEGEDFGVYLV